jgi:hypothetical protein
MGVQTGNKRVEWYVGPDIEIGLDDVEKYEKQGGWVIEPKRDGMWAMLTVGNPKAGRPNILKSRDLRTAQVTGSNAGEFPGLCIPLPESTIIVGELEATSNWATKQFKMNGFRKFHVFDLPYYGADLRGLTWTERRAKLEAAVKPFVIDDHVVARMPLTPYFEDHFRARIEQWWAAGGEGAVLKRKDSLYRSTRTDGKVDFWLRIKKHVTLDYVLCGLAMTKPSAGYPTGQLTGRWGLFNDQGRLVECMQATCKPSLLREENIGMVVVEFEANEVFEGGAMRHARYKREREDKSPEMCRFPRDPSELVAQPIAVGETPKASFGPRPPTFRVIQGGKK